MDFTRTTENLKMGLKEPVVTLKAVTPLLVKYPIHCVLRAYRFLRHDPGLWNTRYRLLPWLPLPRRLSDGNWMLCYPDIMGQIVFQRSPFEEDERAFVAQFLEPGMVFFDVGAHHGLYTLLASKSVKAQGHVYAFEPVPDIFRKLSINLRLNRCRNVVAEQLALGCCQGETDMHVVNGRETGCNSFRRLGPDVAISTSLQRVSVTTIDEYVHKMKINAMDLIKIDAEGAELDVLRGAEGVLNGKSRPLVLCEIEDRRTAPWGYLAREIVDRVAQHGYEWFEPTKDGLMRHRRCKNYDYDGLVAVPPERLRQLGSLLANGGYKEYR